VARNFVQKTGYHVLEISQGLIIRSKDGRKEGGQVPVFGVRRQAPVRQRGSVSL
jgi:hypothetical protein